MSVVIVKPSFIVIDCVIITIIHHYISLVSEKFRQNQMLILIARVQSRVPVRSRDTGVLVSFSLRLSLANIVPVCPGKAPHSQTMIKVQCTQFNVRRTKVGYHDA